MQQTQVQSLVWELRPPHAERQLSPHTATTEPACSRAREPQLESVRGNERSHIKQCNLEGRLQLTPEAAK